MRTLFFDTLSSTQEEARRLYDGGEILAVVASHQTHGKGRRGHTWVSKKGESLLVTFAFSLPLNSLHLESLGLVAAHSLSTLLKPHFPIQIKWPNDLLIQEKKVAGILCEVSQKQDALHLFLGIGLNVNQTEFPPLDFPATSLRLASHHPWDIPSLLSSLQTSLQNDLHLFRLHGFEPFKAPVENLLAYRNQLVQAGEHQGLLHSLSSSGLLNLYHPVTHTMTTLSSLSSLRPIRQ
jgi:BirA family biotin operon repressor/biotin-[acetyl-CoA-carboxylase] ligase